MQSIDDMTDSVERQKIHRLAKLEGKVEGFLQGSRLILVVPGAEKFGPPTSATLKRIDYIPDPGELRRMAVRFVRASGWDGKFGGLSEPGHFAATIDTESWPTVNRHTARS